MPLVPNALRAVLGLIGTGLLALVLQGCTYATMSYTSTLNEAEMEVARRDAPENVEARFAEDFRAEVRKLYQKGYRLLGYASFTSPLKPRFTLWNAKTAAGKAGASLALVAEPVPA